MTKTKAFKRVFVHWAVEHFDWLGTPTPGLLRTFVDSIANKWSEPPYDRCCAVDGWPHRRKRSGLLSV